jgi:arsenite methyltransferase
VNLSSEVINLYESQAMRAITGSVIRPGGFALTDKAIAYCRLDKSTRLLDVGCGTGAGVNHLRSQHGIPAVGIDLSTTLLQEGGQAYAGLPLVRGRAEQLPIADDWSGAIFCECMLSLCDDPQYVLQEFRRILHPGGYLILTDLYARLPGAVAIQGDRSCCLQGVVARSTIKQRLMAAGFALLLWEDHTDLLKQLAAQIIWEHGSLDAFWIAVAGSNTVALKQSLRGQCQRPGYYLAVARRPPPQTPAVSFSNRR